MDDLNMAREVARRVARQGGRSFFVGGFVRDSLLDEVLDVCDPQWIALPEQYLGGEADIAALTVIAMAEQEGAQIRTLSAGDSVELSD